MTFFDFLNKNWFSVSVVFLISLFIIAAAVDNMWGNYLRTKKR